MFFLTVYKLRTFPPGWGVLVAPVRPQVHPDRILLANERSDRWAEMAADGLYIRAIAASRITATLMGAAHEFMGSS